MRETFFVVNLDKNEIWGEFSKFGGKLAHFFYDWGLWKGNRWVFFCFFVFCELEGTLLPLLVSTY